MSLYRLFKQPLWGIRQTLLPRSVLISRVCPIYSDFHRGLSSNKPEEVKVSPQITIRNNDYANQSPLVLIFGWGNGQEKNLLRYSAIFENRDFTTVLVTTTLLNSLFRTSTAGRKESENVKKVLMGLCSENKNRKIVLYPFSNGGCAISHMMVETMDSGSFPGKNIKGQIFDSCPIIPNEESATAVSKAFRGLVKSKVLQPIVSVFAKVMVFIVVNMNKDVKGFMNKMKNSQVTSPQLFLFSKDDDLAPYQDILAFIEERKKRGVNVEYRLWEESQHCGHLRNYPEEYSELVNKFIDEVLEK